MASLLPDLTHRFLCEEALDSDQLADSIGVKDTTTIEGGAEAFETFRRFDGSTDAFIWNNSSNIVNSNTSYYLAFDFVVTNVYAASFKRFWRSVAAGSQGPFLDWDGSNSRFVYATHANGGSSTVNADVPGGLTLGDRMYLGISYDHPAKVPVIVVKSTGGVDVSVTGAVAVAQSSANTNGHQLFKLSGSNRTQADLNELHSIDGTPTSIADMQDTADALFGPTGTKSPIIPKVMDTIYPNNGIMNRDLFK